MNALLEIRDLYGGYEKNVNILQGVDLTVEEGEVVGVVGLNGSGKSTLGKAVMNLIPYRKGTVVFDGQSVEDKNTHQLAHMGISLMRQGGAVFPGLSVGQNLKLVGGALSDLPSSKLQSSLMADKLSGGERQELALAMALAGIPKLVFLDEPSAGLSPAAVDGIYTILDRIKKQREMSMIVIEQNIARAVAFCDKIVLLATGRIEAEFSDSSLDEIEKQMFK